MQIAILNLYALVNRQSDTNQELFARIAEGEEAAFERLYNDEVLAVSRIVFRLVPSEAQTRDIVQEVFLKLWLSRDKLVNVADPSLYLYRIAYNCSFDHIRREQLRERVTVNMSIEPGLLAQSQDGQAIVDFREATRLLALAVHSLHPRSRDIYQLNRTQGLKPQEIADQLHLSVQSVRNSLTRSAKAIRDYLEQHGVVLPVLLILLPLPELIG